MVSICMPTFNGEQYIAGAMESMLRQTYKNMEILVIDDGSADRTGEIIRGYMEHNPSVRFIRNERNLGLAGNWNKCLSEARGDWIKFHFQDDLASDRCVEKMMAPVQTGIFSGRLIICDRDYIFEGKMSLKEIGAFRRIPKLGHYFLEDAQVSSGLFNEIWSWHLLKPNFIGEPIVGMFRKDVIADHGKFDTGLKQIVDFEFWTRIASNEGLYYLNEPLVTFRVHDHSATAAHAREQVNVSLIDRFVFAHKIKYSGMYATFRKHTGANGENLAEKIDDMLLPWYIVLPEAIPLRKHLLTLQESYPHIIPGGFNRKHYIQRIKSGIKKLMPGSL